MATQPQFPGSVKTSAVEIENADGTSFKTLFTAGASGSRIESISATNSDSGTAYVLQLAVQSGTIDYVIGEVNVPAGAGTDGSTKAVDVLNQTDLPWLRDDGVRPYLYLANGDVLRVRVKAAVSSGQKVQLFAQAGDF